MKYRNFGNLDFMVSALGFGAMRLPTDGDTSNSDRLSNNIVEDEAIRMIRYAIDHGVNYIDTAYTYHKGNSEIVTGKALMDGYRNKAKLATKSPTFLINKAEDFNRYLDEQLTRLKTDCIDFYLLHALSRDKWENIVQKFDIISYAEKAKKAGKIKHLGFSFHDNLDAFIEILDGYDGWEFCQMQYNYMDIENQAGTEGIKYAASKGLSVIIMEPLLGGRLANPPMEVLEVIRKSGGKYSPVELAFQWLWSQKEVSVVLSGMSNIEQVKENLIFADRSDIGSLETKDLNTIEFIRKEYNKRSIIPCTKCGYCMPCPNNVDIPQNFSLYNDGIIYNDLNSSSLKYNNFFDKSKRADLCIHCKECEEKCPQKIPISEWMTKIHKELG
ncbi:MAG: aldo/keto reductase [Atribacterota bacterium]|nr:aldo/keto reductase [Atribacterota bacterium]